MADNVGRTATVMQACTVLVSNAVAAGARAVLACRGAPALMEGVHNAALTTSGLVLFCVGVFERAAVQFVYPFLARHYGMLGSAEEYMRMYSLHFAWGLLLGLAASGTALVGAVLRRASGSGLRARPRAGGNSTRFVSIALSLAALRLLQGLLVGARMW